MPRLIAIAPAVDLVRGELTIGTGDVLRFAASGGRVVTGGAVRLLGVYTAGTVATTGEILEPSGPPSAVMFQAAGPGQADIDVVAGSPFQPADTWHVRVTVAGVP